MKTSPLPNKRVYRKKKRNMPDSQGVFTDRLMSPIRYVGDIPASENRKWYTKLLDKILKKE